LQWFGPAWPRGGISQQADHLQHLFQSRRESDITARIQEQALKKNLGVDVAIQYKIGGGGALCWSELVQSAPDGYTIAVTTFPTPFSSPWKWAMPGTRPWI